MARIMQSWPWEHSRQLIIIVRWRSKQSPACVWFPAGQILAQSAVQPKQPELVTCHTSCHTAGLLLLVSVACICVASDFHTGCYLGTQHGARWARSASPADEVTSIENISGQTGPESGCQLVVFVVQVVTSSGNTGGTVWHAALTAAARRCNAAC